MPFASPAQRLFQCVLTLAFSFVLFVAPLWAQDLAANKPSDVRILIDISGSMKKNDPANLRRPALDMLVKLIPEGSHAGVWTFGKFVNMLVKHRKVDNAWKKEASAKAQTIGSVAQNTNIGGVLEKAAYDKAYSNVGQRQVHFILLTDGMVDIDRNPAVNEQEKERILTEVLPNYQNVDYKIHTISLSEKADKQLMDRLALATDGQAVVAKNADELMSVFLRVFDQAVPSEELPFDGNSFVTDSSIEEFTALIFREPSADNAELISPDLKRYSKNSRDENLNWYATEQYDLITVKRPLEGEWKVRAKTLPNSRITVVSDLSIMLKYLPSNIQAGDTLDFSLALQEEGKRIKRAEFLQLMDIDVSVKNRASGSESTQRLSEGLVPGNGIYQTTLDQFNTEGSYTVTAKVDGKSFQRQLTRRVEVRQAFSVDVEPKTSNGETRYNIVVSPNLPDIDFASTEVVAKVRGPGIGSNIQNFTLQKDQTWQWELSASENGQYTVSLRMTTDTDTGRETYTIDPIVITHPQGDEVFTIDKPMAAPELPTLDLPAAEAKETPKPLTQKQPETNPRAKPKPTPEPEPELEAENDNKTQWIIYGVVALINILIIVVVFILYKKLFAKKGEDEEVIEEVEEPQEEEAVPEPEEAEPELEEPPMDEMNLDELEEEDSEDDSESLDIEPDEDNELETEMDASASGGEEGETVPATEEQPIDAEMDDGTDEADTSDDTTSEPDPLDEIDLDALDAAEGDIEEDEEPEFDLDDFAPDSLDDDEDKEKGA